MEKFKKSYPSKTLRWPKAKSWALAGVVGSGNLEVLVEPSDRPDAVSYQVETSIPGFKSAWLAALKDMADHTAMGGCKVTIHDQGGDPVVIKLRIRQAMSQLS